MCIKHYIKIRILIGPFSLTWPPFGLVVTFEPLILPFGFLKQKAYAKLSSMVKATNTVQTGGTLTFACTFIIAHWPCYKCQPVAVSKQKLI